MCAGLYLAAILVDLLRSRRYKRFLLELIPLIGLLILDVLITSASTGYIAFGSGSSPAVAIWIMFGAIQATLHLADSAVTARWLNTGREGSRNYAVGFLRPACLPERFLLAGRFGAKRRKEQGLALSEKESAVVLTPLQNCVLGPQRTPVLGGS